MATKKATKRSSAKKKPSLIERYLAEAEARQGCDPDTADFEPWWFLLPPPPDTAERRLAAIATLLVKLSIEVRALSECLKAK